MAVQAIRIHHQRSRRDEIPRSGLRQRRQKIFPSLGRGGLVLARMRRMQQHHGQRDRADRGAPAQPGAPFDPRAGEAMEDIEPQYEEGRDHVRPVGDRTQMRILEPDVFKLENIQAGEQHAGYLLFSASLVVLITGVLLTRLDIFQFKNVGLKDPHLRSIAYWAHVITPFLVLWLYILHRLAGPRIKWGAGLRWGAAVGAITLAMVLLHSAHPRQNQAA